MIIRWMIVNLYAKLKALDRAILAVLTMLYTDTAPMNSSCRDEKMAITSCGSPD
jgi:hypothetical protein